MRIFVVYASAGAGHTKAAEAIYRHLKENLNGEDVRIIDALDKTTPLFRLSYTWGYPFLINHAVFLWELGFWLTFVRPLRRITRSIAALAGFFNSSKFIEFLIQENPDFIISTHFMTCEIAGNLKKNKKINSEVISVITDFGVHPFWVSAGTDLYVVASDFTRKQLSGEGVSEGIIKVLGIPIDSKFLKQYERGALARGLGIDKDKFTALVITGSFGLGPIEEIADLLHRDVQLLVVCAKNQKLYKRLKDRNYPNCRVYGFVDNVQELMAVSDVIITKPGGLTISEVLAMDLAPIFISAIPGQETENAKALESYGIGCSPKGIEELKYKVLDYKQNPDKLKEIRKKIAELTKLHASEEICNVIRQSRAGAAG